LNDPVSLVVTAPWQRRAPAGAEAECETRLGPAGAIDAAEILILPLV